MPWTCFRSKEGDKFYGAGLKVVLLYVLEVAVSVYLEFAYCKLVSHDYAVRMSLERRKGAGM